MPIIRNPFTRRHGDDTLRPSLTIEPGLKTPPGFERVDTVGSKASSAMSTSSRRSQDNGEYKMSVVNDSGVYLPPSPTAEKEASWPRRYLSRNSTDTRSDVGEIEHFGISRESFDSYRRSFDICAKSPVNQDSFPTRRSMDSTRFPRMPRQRLFDREPPSAVEEGEGEGFEDVGLDEEEEKSQIYTTQQQVLSQPPKKRGFFAKFADHNQENGSVSPTVSPSLTASRFSLLPSRKRAQSMQGSELEERPRSADGNGNAKEMTDVAAKA